MLTGHDPTGASMSDLANHWTIAGNPDRLTAAAAVLRRAKARQVFASQFPGEYVMSGVARLLDALACAMRDQTRLGHEVVSSATEIAEHVLAYVPEERAKR
jgi:hypothetical protein